MIKVTTSLIGTQKFPVCIFIKSRIGNTSYFKSYFINSLKLWNDNERDPLDIWLYFDILRHQSSDQLMLYTKYSNECCLMYR